MTSNRSKGIHQPFEGLDRLIKSKAIPLTPKSPSYPEAPPAKPSSPRREAELFAQEMADVVPVMCNRHWQPPDNVNLSIHPKKAEPDNSTLNALYLLVETGRGFRISDTPEYMEARGPGVQSEICRRLHRGCYSIQDHIDLHGLSVRDAETALNQFIKNAITNGKRAVLVVHGRGLSSPREPVLKQCVYRWLTTGRWMKYVIALTSARGCDGGAGATYVLLRQRPQSKSVRKMSPAFQASMPRS